MVSAIVPTHDRPGVLRRCLETLQTQDVGPDQLEVVVVDDGSEADIRAIVDQIAASGPIVMRCERQPLGGLNLARNRGIQIASGEVLAFLDDDTLVAPGWARALTGAFAQPACAGVGGRVRLKLEGAEPAWLGIHRCFLGEYELGDEGRWLTDEDPVPIGANCAVRRREFDRVGGFSSGLDRHGRSLVSNGDTEFFQRLRASGGRLRYEAGALVDHCVPAARLSRRYMARRFYGQGMSAELQSALYGVSFSWRRKLGLARFAAGGAKMLCQDVLHGRGVMDGLFAVGYWAGRSAAHRPSSFEARR